MNMDKTETKWFIVYVMMATVLGVLFNNAVGLFAALFAWGLIMVLFVVGTLSDRYARRKRKWCVFDGADPQNQVIIEARTADEAIAEAAKQVFGLMAEEAQ